MKSFIQDERGVSVNNEYYLSLEAFLLLAPKYSYHKEYSIVRYVAQEGVMFVELNSPIDKPELLNDELMWPEGEAYIKLVEDKYASQQVEVEEATTTVNPDSVHIHNFLLATKKERKAMLVAIPLLSEPEVYLDLLKRARNSLLMRSDWAVMSDYPFTEEQRAPWIAYRKELRDYMQLIKDKSLLDLPQLPVAPN